MKAPLTRETEQAATLQSPTRQIVRVCSDGHCARHLLPSRLSEVMPPDRVARDQKRSPPSLTEGHPVAIRVKSLDAYAERVVLGCGAHERHPV